MTGTPDWVGKHPATAERVDSWRDSLVNRRDAPMRLTAKSPAKKRHATGRPIAQRVELM